MVKRSNKTNSRYKKEFGTDIESLKKGQDEIKLETLMMSNREHGQQSHHSFLLSGRENIKSQRPGSYKTQCCGKTVSAFWVLKITEKTKQMQKNGRCSYEHSHCMVIFQETFDLLMFGKYLLLDEHCDI